MSDERRDAVSLVAAVSAFVAWHEELGAEGFVRASPRRAPGIAAPLGPTIAREPGGDPAAARPIITAEPIPAPIARAPIARAAEAETGSGRAREIPTTSEHPPSPMAEPAARTAQPQGPSIASGSGPHDRLTRLRLLDETVRTCARCELCQERTQTVFSRGDPSARVMFIGEGPGADEDREGLPFVGKAGQLLDKMIGAMGLTEREVYIANVVKCRPPGNRTPLPAEMAACLPYLKEQIAEIEPRVIVGLGGTAIRGLLGITEGITRIRGQFRVYEGRIPVMPTFHPAYVLRQPTKEVRAMVWSDLVAVLKELGRAPPTRGGAPTDSRSD